MVVIFVVALSLVFYTYVLYPVAIALLARFFPTQTVRDPSFTPMVSAIIPVYNAKPYIRDKIESLLNLDYPSEKLEIRIMSDASDDGTDKVLGELAREHPQVHVSRMKTRSGKPTLVNAMIQQAKGEVLLMTDIRQPLGRASLRELVSRLADPTVGAVSGNLVLEGAQGAGVYWKYENAIRRSEGRFRSMVGVTGPLYAIRARDLGSVPSHVILDDMWIPMRLRLEGKRIVFAENALATDDAFGDSREFGRKVRTLAGNFQLFALLPKLLVPGVNPSWFEVMSHKVCRLLCPWGLMALFLSSALLSAEATSAPAIWRGVALVLLAGQIAFYGLALGGGRLGALGRVSRTFVVLNWAAVVGFWRFARSAQKVTW